MIEFFLTMVPPTVTQQEHKVSVVNGKARFYDPPDLKAARQKFMTALVPFVPAEKITGPIRLITKWIWPIEKPSGGQMALTDFMDPDFFTWKTTKPDTDNLIKLFKDCMTRVGFWEDDCQVASEITEKMLGMHPGIYVKVTQL